MIKIYFSFIQNLIFHLQIFKVAEKSKKNIIFSNGGHKNSFTFFYSTCLKCIFTSLSDNHIFA